MPSEEFTRLLGKSREIADLSAAVAVLDWDQETYMPHGSAAARADQIATLSTVVHKAMVADDYSALLNRLRSDSSLEGLEEWEQCVVTESGKNWDKATKLPEEYVRDVSQAQSIAQHHWKEAREKSDFQIFADPLARLVELKRKEAGFYGYRENPYDALIDLFEPGMTAAQLRPVFDRLRTGTKRLLKMIEDAGVSVRNDFLFREFDREKQLEYGRMVVEQLGFDFEHGRIDLTAHPFCTSFGSSDVRLTTRVFNHDLRS